LTYTTPIHALPAPDPLPAGAGPDVPLDLKALADALDPKLTPYSHGAGAPGIAAGKAGRRYRDDSTGDVYLDIGAAWVLETPASNAVAATPSLRKLGVGATDAAAGNDPRLADVRTPADNSVTAAKVHTSLKPSTGAAAATEALRALGTAAGTAAAGNDARMANQRVPTDGSVTTAKLEDPLNIQSGGDITINRAGLWLVTMGIHLTDPNNVGRFNARALVQTAADPANPFGVAYAEGWGGTGMEWVARTSEPVRLEVGDNVYGQAYQSGGGSGVRFVGGLSPSGTTTFLKMVYLGQ
jgi:hypothetical protein